MRNKRQRRDGGLDRSLKIMMIAVCVIPLFCVLYFYLLGWNLYHDKSLMTVYGLVMGIGSLAAVGISALLVYRYVQQRRAKRNTRFDYVLLLSWLLLIATFFSYLSSNVYGLGFSNITPAFIVMIAPLALVILRKTSNIGSLVFGVITLLATMLEVIMIFSMASVSRDAIWTVALPSWLGLFANVFAVVALFARLYHHR